MKEQFDLNDLLRGIADGHASLVRTGMRAADDRYQLAIRALDKGMQAAALDPEAKIPSYLSAVIHVLLTMQPSAAIAQENAYANAAIKRDQLARHEGQPEHDQDVVGRPLKAGS